MGMVSDVARCTASARAARKLQLVNHPGYLDHVPMFLEVSYRLDVVRSGSDQRWDADALVRAYAE
eukprot:10262225-Alexandrium_andersonii.AAC.1